MTTTPHRHASEPTTPEDDSYVSLDLDDGVMIYDVDCETAWVQSDTALDVESMA